MSDETKAINSSEDEQELLERAQRGERDALEQLLSRYQSRVYRLAYGILRNPEDAEEVIQEVFLKVFQKLDSFKGESAFSSWLYRIAINTTYMKLRNKKGSSTLSLEDIDKLIDERLLQGGADEWTAHPDDELLTEEAMRIISNAMEKLPADFKMVWILRDIEGFSTEEVAELLNLTVPSVKSKLHRARLLLRKKLGDFYRQMFQG